MVLYPSAIASADASLLYAQRIPAPQQPSNSTPFYLQSAALPSLCWGRNNSANCTGIYPTLALVPCTSAQADLWLAPVDTQNRQYLRLVMPGPTYGRLQFLCNSGGYNQNAAGCTSCGTVMVNTATGDPDGYYCRFSGCILSPV